MNWFRGPCLLCKHEYEHEPSCMYYEAPAPKGMSLEERLENQFQTTVEWYPFTPSPPPPERKRGFFAALLAALGFLSEPEAVPSVSRRGFLKGALAFGLAGTLVIRAPKVEAPREVPRREPYPYPDLEPLAYLNQFDGVKLIQLHIDGVLTRDIL